MKNMTIFILLIMLAGSVAYSQPPLPSHRSKSNANVKNGEIEEKSGPIGTASALLLTLGTLTLACKLYKNKNPETKTKK